MKKKLIVLFALVFTSSIVFAEANLRVDPLRTLTGVPSLSLDFKVDNSWSLGPSFSYMNRSDGGFFVTAYAVGIRGNYYFNNKVFSQGWYLGPALGYLNVRVKGDDAFYGDLVGSAAGVYTSLFGGFQWMWEKFNINLGAGPVYYSLTDIRVESSRQNYSETYGDFSGLGLGLEFTLGWKF